MKVKNRFSLATAIPLMGIIALASGCGGGGGGGGGGSTLTSFVKWSAITPPTTVEIEGKFTDASYTAALNHPYVVLDIPSSSITQSGNPATATITYRADGTISAIGIQTPNGTYRWNEPAGDFIDDTTELVAAENQAGTLIGLAANAVHPNVNWEYQTFGAWLDGYSLGSGMFGAVSLGAPTAGASIPTTTTPAFTGYVGGAYVDAAGESYVALGGALINVDFAARSLDFTSFGTEIINANTATSSTANNLNMSGTLTYNAGENNFSGTLNATGLSGDSNGQFYGPNAEELGGVFLLRGAGVESYAGAYGAKR